MKPEPKYRFMPGDRVRINERVPPEHHELLGSLATVNRISLAVIHDANAKVRIHGEDSRESLLRVESLDPAPPSFRL